MNLMHMLCEICLTKVVRSIRCDMSKEAEINCTIGRTPPVLMLDLDRGALDGTKNKQKVIIDEELQLGGEAYVLEGMLKHLGSSSRKGHYVADIKDPQGEKWFTCDNENVSPREKCVRESSSVSMMFYVKKSIIAMREDERVGNINASPKKSSVDDENAKSIGSLKNCLFSHYIATKQHDHGEERPKKKIKEES